MGIDWILKYYISTAIRRVKERRSSQWPVVDGTVYASEALGLRELKLSIRISPTGSVIPASTRDAFGSRIQRRLMLRYLS